MNDIGPRTKVECIRAFDTHQLHAVEVAPVVGRIYTVRNIVRTPGLEGFLLEEIINPPINHRNGFNECAFNIDNFRPVRTTDISIFTKIDLEVKRGIRRVLEDA